MRTALAMTISVSLAFATVTTAAAQDGTPPTPANPKVGGHLGVGFGILDVSNVETTVIGDDFLAIGPVAGVNVALDEHWSFDLETIMLAQWLNTSTDQSRTNFVLAPGVIYDWGFLSTGLRAAMRVPRPTAEIGVVPIFIKTFPLGPIRYYAELDLPVFFYGAPPEEPDETLRVSLTVFLQTGVAF